MRVLLVSHRFLPTHSAGTEVYTAELARRLGSRGHQVAILTTDKDTGRDDLEIRRRTFEGFEVVEITNNLYHDRFDQTWDNPAVDALFRRELDRLCPDVVHFQHLMYLSVGCVTAARAAGAAVLMTLHDYWLECPRMGQLVHADGELCAQVDFERCGTCLPSYPWNQSGTARWTGKALAQVRRMTGIDLGPLARRARRAFSRSSEPSTGEGTRPGQRGSFVEAARRRSTVLEQRVPAAVHRFLCPSQFLRERLVAWGLPPEHTFYVPTGLAGTPGQGERARPTRSPGDPLEVLFLGTLVPLKGAHVLVEAWGRLDPGTRARGVLRLHGPRRHQPEYGERLARRAKEVGAQLRSGLDRAGVREAMERADLLVVPSLWFENRPLVLLEALEAGVPLLVSDLGGMAELVEEGATGWRFPMGDAEALAQRLEILLSDPTRLESLTGGGDDHLVSWEACTDEILEHYAACLAGLGVRP